MSLIGGIASVIGGALDATGWLSHSSAKSMAKYQEELGVRAATEAARKVPSAQRAGLEAAGYNPMLAVAGTSPGSPGAMPSGHVNSSNLGKDIREGVNQMKLLESEKESVDANTNLTNERSKTEKVNRILNVAKTVAGAGFSAYGAYRAAQALKNLANNPNAAKAAKTLGKALSGADSAKAARSAIDAKQVKQILGLSASPLLPSTIAGPIAGGLVPLGMHLGVGKYLESKGYEPPPPNPRELRHRTSGLGSWRSSPARKRRHN